MCGLTGAASAAGVVEGEDDGAADGAEGQREGGFPAGHGGRQEDAERGDRGGCRGRDFGAAEQLESLGTMARVPGDQEAQQGSGVGEDGKGRRGEEQEAERGGEGAGGVVGHEEARGPEPLEGGAEEGEEQRAEEGVEEVLGDEGVGDGAPQLEAGEGGAIQHQPGQDMERGDRSEDESEQGSADPDDEEEAGAAWKGSPEMGQPGHGIDWGMGRDGVGAREVGLIAEPALPPGEAWAGGGCRTVEARGEASGEGWGDRGDEAIGAQGFLGGVEHAALLARGGGRFGGDVGAWAEAGFVVHGVGGG